MTANSNVLRSAGNELDLNEASPIAPVGIVDSLKVGEWLLAESERNTQQKETDRQINEDSISGTASAHFYDALEEGFYWLICAVALACLVLGMLGL
jgi:hypothetical protein